MLGELVRQKQAGELSVEALQVLESMLLRTRTQTSLLDEKMAEVRRRLDAKMSERSEVIHAVKSSKAFLGRGFRDIEMLLEAGFRELEDQRTSFMANRRKKLRQRIEKDRARRAQRTAYVRPLGEEKEPLDGNDKGAKAGNDDDEEEVVDDESGSGADSSGDESFDDDALATMDFDELQARLAANDAKERRSVRQSEGERGRSTASQAEAEAADVRRTEYSSLAQSKMGKQQQIEELGMRVEKEQAAAVAMRERLEGAMADEQDAMAAWSRLDAELQAAELDRATVVAAKQKAKELALEKAQVAESGLEELKEAYRELKRKEEKTLRSVREAEKQGALESTQLDLQADGLKHSKITWAERLKAADEDRKALFDEAQNVERKMRAEKARKQEAQASAAHYRNLMKDQM